MQYPPWVLTECVVIVRGHDDRAILLHKVVEQLENAMRRFGIEVARGFVRDDQRRFIQ